MQLSTFPSVELVFKQDAALCISFCQVNFVYKMQLSAFPSVELNLISDAALSISFCRVNAE